MKANTRCYFITVLKWAASGSTVSGSGQVLLHIYLTNAGICSTNVAPRSDQRTFGWSEAGARAVPVHSVTWCKLQGSSVWVTGLQKLEVGRTQLCLKFAKGLASSNEFSIWLPPQRTCHQRNLSNNYKLSLLPSQTRQFDRSLIANLVHTI